MRLCAMPRPKRSPLKFEERIAAEKARLETQVAHLQHGPERDALQKKIRQLAVAVHMNEWMTSPGLQPPIRLSGFGSKSRPR
jgi:hypothetical protein